MPTSQLILRHLSVVPHSGNTAKYPGGVKHYDKRASRRVTRVQEKLERNRAGVWMTLQPNRRSLSAHLALI
uniref:Transposase n=1 Tax=Heterorhabditis bacteriophora TaxID=37862 RepID=A0A1I7XNI3_HETBA